METDLLKQISVLCDDTKEKVYNEVEHSAYLDNHGHLKDSEKIKAELTKIMGMRSDLQGKADDSDFFVDITDIDDHKKADVERKLCNAMSISKKPEHYITQLVKFNVLGVLQKELCDRLIVSASGYVKGII